MASWIICYKITKRKDVFIQHRDRNKAVWTNYARDLPKVFFVSEGHTGNRALQDIDFLLSCVKKVVYSSVN
jgi:hypothetical protein